MTGSSLRLLEMRSRISYVKAGSASFRRQESAEADIAPDQGEGKRLAAGKAARNPVRRLGFSRSERSEDTYDGLGTRDSSHQETTRHYWVWRRVEIFVAGLM